jgi:hypothetical protein
MHVGIKKGRVGSKLYEQSLCNCVAPLLTAMLGCDPQNVVLGGHHSLL